jgi:hypothetical protein
MKAIQLPHVKSRLEEMGEELQVVLLKKMKNMVNLKLQKWIRVVQSAQIPKQ